MYQYIIFKIIMHIHSCEKDSLHDSQDYEKLSTPLLLPKELRW